MEFNDWLSLKIEEKKLSNSDVAKAVEVKPTTVSRWRKGTRTPESPQIIRLAKLFQEPPDTLLWMIDPQGMAEAVQQTSQGDDVWSSVLAHVPELREIYAGLARLPVDQRAALLVIIRTMIPPPSEQ